MFAKDLLRKWEANIPFRVEFDGESIGSILRARGDLQQRHIARNGAGNDLLRLEIKRKPGNPDLTRLEKSDSSRDFFSCLDFVGDRADFFVFFDFR